MDFYLENDRLDRAEPLLVEAITLARAEPASPHRGLSKLLTDLAGIHRARSRFEDAITVMRESVAVEKAASVARPLILANRLVNLGHLHLDHGDQMEAAECFKEAMQWLPGHMPFTLKHNAHRGFKVVSAALEGLGETSDATIFQEIAVDIEREMCEPTTEDDPISFLDDDGAFERMMKLELAQSLFDLGCLYLPQDRITQAESTLRESLEIREALLPAEHSRIARARQTLASLPSSSETSGRSSN